MATQQRTSAEAYERLALAEPDRKWELHDGVLVEKPPVTIGHSVVLSRLMHSLSSQLDPARYRVSVSFTRLRHTASGHFIPDLLVIPAEQDSARHQPWHDLEIYDVPLPLVVEIWSPSTGGYDVETKLPAYRARGDAEIWRLHPFERTLSVWRKLADGTYDETVYRGGVVPVASLPAVSIDLDALFAP